MNANQQKLNLDGMENTKARVSYKDTSKKWLKFISHLKKELDTNNVNKLHPYTRKHNVSNSWVAFLKTNKIIYIDDYGYYQWNTKIPVSSKIIDAFRVYQAKTNTKYIQRSNIQENKIKRRLKLNTTKVSAKILVENTESKQIGLIRKFLKWIY
jgi:hypothetical protein